MTYEAIRHAIDLLPDNHDHILILADWCEENDNKEAEFWRWVVRRKIKIYESLGAELINYYFKLSEISYEVFKNTKWTKESIYVNFTTGRSSFSSRKTAYDCLILAYFEWKTEIEEIAACKVIFSLNSTL